VRTVRYRAVVHGRVQGVLFRDSTRRHAEEHGVAGWVRNAPDGTVEAVFEGPEPAVAAMLRFTALGPPEAEVDRIVAGEESPEGLQGFRIV
jgi:acylphosphatase